MIYTKHLVPAKEHMRPCQHIWYSVAVPEHAHMSSVCLWGEVRKLHGIYIQMFSVLHCIHFLQWVQGDMSLVHYNDPCIHFLHPPKDDSTLRGHGQYAYLLDPPDLPQQPVSLRWALANHWVILGCNPQCEGKCAQWAQWWTVLWWAASPKLRLTIFIYVHVY